METTTSPEIPSEDGRGAVLEFTLGDRLRKAREHAQISVENMAATLGVSRNTVTSYERRPGKRGVPPMAVYAWAAATGVSLEWLAGNEMDELTERWSDLPNRPSRCTGPRGSAPRFRPLAFDR